MRFGFVTCVQLGLSCMEAIYRSGGALDLAVTLEDDMAPAKSGRVYIDDFCARRAIPLVKTRSINSEAIPAAIRVAGIDWLFIIGWSQIARKPVLDAPARGTLGIHPTLLPEGRGRAAIPWAILKGLDRTGVTLFKLDEGVDTGPIVAQRPIPLRPHTTATELYRTVERAHAELIADALPKLQADSVDLRPQDEARASHWPGRRPEDGAIDLGGSVHDAERLVRAVTRPYPGAFADLPQGRLRIWRAEIGDRPAVATIRFRDGTLACVEAEWERRGAEDRVGEPRGS